LLAAVVDQLPSTGLDIRQVDSPRELTKSEALIRVDACGICGTDLHILAGESYRPSLPFVLGHEPVGVIEALGDEMADGVSVGTSVTMTIFEGCGECALCLRGDQRLCANLRSIVGVSDRWGGFAEFLVVPAAQLIPIPTALGSLKAACLVDAGATAANAVRSASASDHSHAIVVGGGPVGLLVGELLRKHGVSPLVVEPNEVRRTALFAMGYQVAIGLSEVGVEPTCVFECSGAEGVIQSAAGLLRPHGTLVLVGYRREYGVDFGPISRKELRIIGVRSGRREDLISVMDLAARGNIRIPAPRTWGLPDVNEALTELRAGRVAGKAVVTCNSQNVFKDTLEAGAWTH
jgi:2-desacetyl-2-hydroxyethyl bacteriochlorophyllide A dehydrogenase